MKSGYFIVVLGHSVHGRIRRIKVPHYAVHLFLAGFVLAAIAGFGLSSSYGRMLSKTLEFNELRDENERLLAQFDDLKRLANERNQQVASLGKLASEVSIAYGIKRNIEDESEWLAAANEGEFHSNPSEEFSYGDSVDQFGFLKKVQLDPSAGDSLWQFLEDTTPAIWPVKGRISSGFGGRLDPFHGRGTFHGGIDLNAPVGEPIVSTADGVIISVGWNGGYGNAVVIKHGNSGLTSRYAHMSEIFARQGQVVRRGEVIGRVGRTGRATGMHLHYEVRYRGTPINPYRFLNASGPKVAGLEIAD